MVIDVAGARIGIVAVLDRADGDAQRFQIAFDHALVDRDAQRRRHRAAGVPDFIRTIGHCHSPLRRCQKRATNEAP
jgi:hypothetical protein